MSNVIPLRSTTYRCSHCDVRQISGKLLPHWRELDGMARAVDEAFSWAVRSDTKGTIGALCEQCAAHVADLLEQVGR